MEVQYFKTIPNIALRNHFLVTITQTNKQTKKQTITLTPKKYQIRLQHLETEVKSCFGSETRLL